MTAHKHAAFMLQYAKDAAETNEPWKRWEVRHNGQWNVGIAPLLFDESGEYRRKQRTITIAGLSVPMPLTEVPEDGAAVWVTVPAHEKLCFEERYYINKNEQPEQKALQDGMLHGSEEAAIAHAKALIKATRDAMEAAK